MFVWYIWKIIVTNKPDIILTSSLFVQNITTKLSNLNVLRKFLRDSLKLEREARSPLLESITVPCTTRVGSSITPQTLRLPEKLATEELQLNLAESRQEIKRKCFINFSPSRRAVAYRSICPVVFLASKFRWTRFSSRR